MPIWCALGSVSASGWLVLAWFGVGVGVGVRLGLGLG